MRGSLHHMKNKKHHWLLMSVVILTPALLSWSSPFVDKTAAATPTDDRTSQAPAKKTGSTISTGTNTAIPPTKKSHRLIRRPPPSTTASTQPASVALTPATPTANSAAPALTTPQESATAQVKETSANKSAMPMALAAPLASPIVGQLTPTIAPTSSPLIGSSAPSRRTAAADSGLSAPNAPASMRRLFSEIPGVAQIAAYEDPDPTVTAPTIVRNPSTLSFSAVQNGSAPAVQALTISNSGPGALTWTASSNSAWLTLNSVASVSGSNLGSVNVAVNPSGLTVGTHSGVITVIGAGAANSPQTVTVTFDITAAPTPTIGLSATSLSFSAVQGGSNPANRTISISNSGSGTLNWTASESATWLNINPASGTGTGTITVSANTAGMTAGTSNAPITIAATGATNTPQIVTVSLIVTAPAAIGFSPTSLGFTATQGGANPTSQALTISNTGGGTLTWTASDNAAWLSLAPASGTGNGTITLTATTGALTNGTYNGTITLSAPGATTVTVPVTFTITAASSLAVTPPNLSFTATQGGSNPANQTIAVTSNSTWTATKNGSWLTVTPTSGSNNGTITVSVNAASATVGNNTGTVTITGGGITRTVSITLTLNAAATSSATLTWTANKESDLAGYKIYRATASGAYGIPIATLQGNNVVTYVATGLQSGTTYFFVVTAYDSAGNESTVSNEVSKSIF